MIRIANEAELLDSFRALDRDQVQLSPDFQFPLAVKDYLSWVEPSGHRVYLVFPDDGSLRGVVFERTSSSSEVPVSMCQWCHSVRRGSGVGLLTASAGRNRRVGVYLCRSLECKDNVMSPPTINDFSEGLSGSERLQRVVRRMSDFARANLF